MVTPGPGQAAGMDLTWLVSADWALGLLLRGPPCP